MKGPHSRSSTALRLTKKPSRGVGGVQTWAGGRGGARWRRAEPREWTLRGGHPLQSHKSQEPPPPPTM